MDIKKEILKTLKKYPDGVIIEVLASAVGISRQTASTYVREMVAAGDLEVEEFATAKIVKLKGGKN